MEINTKYGRLIEEEKRRAESFGREREMERVRLRQIGANYSNWEAVLEGHEGKLRQMEIDLHERERQLLLVEADFRNAQERERKVIVSLLISISN